MHLSKSFICGDIDVEDLQHFVKDRKKEKIKTYVAVEIV